MPERSFFLLRMVIWLVLLLALWGIVQYGSHAWAVLHAQQVRPAATAVVVVLLAWDVLYLVLAVATVVAAAGCLGWRAGARRWLRALAWGLAVYALVGAVVLFAKWHGTDPSATELIARSVDPVVARAEVARRLRILLMGTVLKGLAAPLLAWLGWRLGQADTVRRFAR